MTAPQALAYVRERGVVLVSAQGPVPRLVEAIAGEPVKGSWWSHPKAHRIFATLEDVTDSPDILVCRLVGDKLTLVHRRLWPALVRAARRFPARRLALVRQEHTASGRHVNHIIAFPKWVPPEAARKARRLTEEDALSLLGEWASQPELTAPRRASRSAWAAAAAPGGRGRGRGPGPPR